LAEKVPSVAVPANSLIDVSFIADVRSTPSFSYAPMISQFMMTWLKCIHLAMADTRMRRSALLLATLVLAFASATRANRQDPTPGLLSRFIDY